VFPCALRAISALVAGAAFTADSTANRGQHAGNDSCSGINNINPSETDCLLWILEVSPGVLQESCFTNDRNANYQFVGILTPSGVMDMAPTKIQRKQTVTITVLVG